ncbi:MAG: right-handed parallel beta-helix repeat-containing protein, partial [Candidatus Freyarchaeota archaeon]
SSSVIREKMDISSDYNFTGNIYEPIVVTADNIVIDGRGYTLQGSGSGCGFNLTGRKNVTIKNVVVTGWQYGFYLYNSSHNTLSGNTANNNDWGFQLAYSSNNTLSNNTATDNFYSGFRLQHSSYNNLSCSTAANNRRIGFHLYNSSYNNLTGNTAAYNGQNGFALWSNCSHNIITDNTVVNFWGYKNFYISGSSYNNIVENNTVISTGLSLLGTLLCGAYISFYSYRYSVYSVSTLLMVGSLVAVALVCSVVVYRRRKCVAAGEGVWKLPEDAFLAGTVGGVVGAITAAVGIIWVILVDAFLTEIHTYLGQLTHFFMILIPLSWYYSYPYHGYPYPIVPPLPHAFLFGVSSVILSILLVATGILIGFGFYGTYETGGGAVGLRGLTLVTIGITLGALLITVGTLTKGYMYADVVVELTSNPFLPVPTPNFPVIWMGFIVLGFTFIQLGSASISVREMTQKPSASNAAGILSILGAITFLIGGFIWPVILVVGFILILVASILWTAVFYLSKEL